MPATVELKTPLTTHSGQVSTIELRDLTAKDMVECRTAPIAVTEVSQGQGNTRTREFKYEYKYDTMMVLLARLSGIDTLLLEAMSAVDFQKCSAAIANLWNANAGE